MRLYSWSVAAVIASSYSPAQTAPPLSTRAAHEKTPHVLDCPESPTAGERPANMECAILVRKVIPRLPQAPIVWRLETFSSMAAAERAQTSASAVVRAAGKIWLMSISQPGQRSTDATYVAEVGPLAIPSASTYELLVAEAYAGADAMNRPHTHSGPEAWYVIAGRQCVETPDGTKSAKAGEAMFEPADTPMRLSILGPETRDAFFIVVHDPARPWNVLSEWQPKGLCIERMPGQ